MRWVGLAAGLFALAVCTGTVAAGMFARSGQNTALTSLGQGRAFGSAFFWADLTRSTNTKPGVEERDLNPAGRFQFDPGPLELGVGRPHVSLFARAGSLRWGAGASGAIAYGWLAGSQGRAVFFAGSSPVGWGPSSLGGLLFSETAGPFERLEVSITWNTLQFTRFVGWLDQNRSVVATRLDILYRPNLRVGFGESIVMQGPPYAAYLAHPVPWLLNYYFLNKVRAPAGRDDNYLMALDFEWLPRPGVRMFGEVLIDDFTVPMNNVSFPSRWGLILGTNVVSPRRGLDTSIQYAIVPNWTYSSGAGSPQYLLRGNPLGHPLGADFDLIHIRLALLGESAPVTYWISYIRKGEGEVGRIWMDETEARTYRFLRGTVEFSTIVGFDVPFNWRGWEGSLKPWLAHRANARHQAGAVRIDSGVKLSITRSF